MFASFAVCPHGRVASRCVASRVRRYVRVMEICVSNASRVCRVWRCAMGNVAGQVVWVPLCRPMHKHLH